MQAPRPRGRRCFPIYGGARAQILHCGRRVGRHRSRRLDRCAATRGAIRDQANAVAASRRAGRQLRSDHRRCRGPGQHEHRAPRASRCGDRLRRRRHAHAARRRRGAACIEPRRIVQGGGGRRTRRTKRRSAREGGCRVYRRKGQAARVACAPSGTLAADPEKVWHGVLSDEPPGFDPAGATSASAASVLELVFDRLLTYDYLARPAKVVPLAAEALPIAEDDAKTWTVRIRKGIYFAPDPAFKGVRRELVAQDFVFSFMRFMDPEINSPYQFLFRIKLIGLDELRAKAQKTGRFDYDARIAGIEAVDRYTVRFHLREPDRRFLYLLAHSSAGAVAREAVDAYGKDIAVHPVGSGPYMLTSWNAGAKAILEAILFPGIRLELRGGRRSARQGARRANARQ